MALDPHLLYSLVLGEFPNILIEIPFLGIMKSVSMEDLMLNSGVNNL